MARLPVVGDVTVVQDDDGDDMTVKVVAVDLDESVWTCVVKDLENTLVLVSFDENGNAVTLGLPEF